ncbi:MAG: peptide ABC transporter substrate-binding protein [Candidatus Doudnabacteria bacterium]
MNPKLNNWNKGFLNQLYSGFKSVPKLRLSVIRKVFSLMSKWEQRILLALITVAILSFVFSANGWLNKYTQVVPTTGGSYAEGIIGQPRFINPILASTNTDKTLVNLIYAGLYKYDGRGNVIPELATEFPQVSEDQLTYTITIKDNAQWHNGLPVTAEDVVFTINTIKNPEYNSPLNNDWLSTEAQVVDARTVKFILPKASGLFLNNLTLPIISKNLWSDIKPSDFVLSQNNIEAIGNGPYKVKEVKKLTQGSVQTITLEAFDQFVDQSAYIESLKLYFYNSAEELVKAVHGKQVNGFGFSQFDDDKINVSESGKNLTIHQIPLPQYQAVFINTANKTLGDVRVRQALNLTANAPKILEEVYDNQGILINSPILAQHVDGLPETITQVNPEEAGALLDQAGWTKASDQEYRSKGSTALELTLATNDTPINVQTAEVLRDQWYQLGIKLNLNILPTKELTESAIKPRNYDLLLFAQKLGADPDPFIFWHSSQTKNPGLNLSNYNNTTIDALITDARKASDKTTRDQLYIQMHELFKADLPAIFLVQTVYTYAIGQNIQGFSIENLPNEPTRAYNIPYWYQDTRRALK